MGYYSSYTLEIEHPKMPTTREIIAELRAENCAAEYALCDSGETGQTEKWYENDTDMKAFSRRYPGHLFTLRITGEDGKKTVRYFRNGKSQTAEVIETYEEFDPEKLT